MRCSMNNRRNKGMKAVTLFLILMMAAFALAGCKKSGSSDEETEKKDYVYVPEYQQIDLGISSSNMNVNSAVAHGDNLYLAVSS